jgi:hypothetical protein
MNTGFNCPTLKIVAALAIGVLTATAASADVTYAWSGHLRLFDNAGLDPWLIGRDGADFKLQTTVGSTATDANDTQVPFAVFTASSAHLWIDGEEVLYVDGAVIDFSDIANVADIVTAGGVFSKLGQSVDISSVIGLDPSTYTFILPSEVPPLFAPTATSSLATSVHSPYVASVETGTTVEVVPEPGLISLAMLAFIFAPYICRAAKRR